MFRYDKKTMSAVDSDRGVTITRSLAFRDASDNFIYYIYSSLKYKFEFSVSQRKEMRRVVAKNGTEEERMVAVASQVRESIVRNILDKLSDAGSVDLNEPELIKSDISEALLLLDTFNGLYLRISPNYRVEFIK